MANKIKLSPSRQMTRVSMSLRGRKIRQFAQHGLHVRTGMSVPKTVPFLAFSLAHRPQRDSPSAASIALQSAIVFLFCFLSRFLMAACFHEKWMETSVLKRGLLLAN
jgi:hypothetical protein